MVHALWMLPLLVVAMSGALLAVGVEPEIDVQGNGVSIVNGDIAPSVADDTEFGNAEINTGTVTHTFTIENTGLGALNLSGAPLVDITGDLTGEFTVSAVPTTPVAAGGGTTTFVVTFDPSAVGLRTAKVSIANDDGDENPYDFDIQGMGVTPEIDVQGNGVSIVDGATPPVAGNDTEFGNVNVVSGALVHTFTILNTGSANLNLTGAPLVAVGGAHVGDFTVAAGPTTPVTAGGGTTTFQVTFDPLYTGRRTATVTIANDDSDESSYTFDIQGTGVFVQPPGGVGVSGPAASTSAASGVTQNAATLHGVVNANNSSTTARFQYGAGNGSDTASAALDVVYTDTVPAGENPVTGSVLTAVSAVIDGLTANTTYHFRVVADNAKGTTYGLDATFTTAVRFVGNVLNDGVLDLLDVRLCAQMAVGDVVGSAEQRAAADVDGDGDVDMEDVIVLSEYVLGIRTTLP